jgi:hypothetical protein
VPRALRHGVHLEAGAPRAAGFARLSLSVGGGDFAQGRKEGCNLGLEEAEVALEEAAPADGLG